ncbi:transposase [Salipaludibacillus agaradhaerens]|uniref:Transposase n=1 Tax=Salipaludibacillus agaradhaerens TaxID=76935 RepID=A0A9Q4B2W5_SALAG|nr:transposase [Salipaludibacillus agaradhaerens]MCR6113137.1 transposase [Salipaludibacillus agaradhaerens]
MNELDHWFKSSDHENTKERLESWFKSVGTSGNHAFKKFVKTYKGWKLEILHSFMYPYNNGYIEGINNTTKVMKRLSYGIKSFEGDERKSYRDK